MIVAVVAVVIAISVGIAIWAGRGHRTSGIGEFLVGGRSFPGWLVYFLAVGEVYSIGTMIGLPSGIYANGASYGIWFLGYILLAYVFGYFLAPLVWRAGRRYDAMTLPDLLRGHFGNRGLELTACVFTLLALLPWGEYQFIGLQVVLTSLGLNLTPLASVVIAAVLAFAYIAVSGIRSPAFVSILKDTLMVAGVVAVGVAALVATNGLAPTRAALPASGAPAGDTVIGSAMTFALTTIVFQAVVFYLGLGTGYIFPARSERTVKSSTVWMPLYMLIYPFLVVASYYGRGLVDPGTAPNTVFMVIARNSLPTWLVGIVAAAALLSGLLVLAATALSIGGMVSRNLMPDLAPQAQRRVTTLFVAVFLVLAAVLALVASALMLTVLTLFYGLIAQVVPAVVAVLFARRVPPRALTVGLIVGVAATVVLYQLGPSVGGVNSGLIAMLVNVAIVVVWRMVAPGPEREPVAGGPRRRVRPVATVVADA